MTETGKREREKGKRGERGAGEKSLRKRERVEFSNSSRSSRLSLM
jgi:hypothetical protein